MIDLAELDPNGVASLALRALPDAPLLVFTSELRIALAAGDVPTRDRHSAPEIEGQPASQALPPEHWKRYEELFRAALAGRSGSFELEPVDDGRWYRVAAEPLRDAAGEVLGGLALWRDITERKRLVGELEQRGRLLDLAHDAIIVREPATSAVTYWNREAGEIYGYSADEASGRISHDLLATEFPESREAVNVSLLARGRWEGALWHVRRDGRRILVSSRQALVRGARGDPLAVIELNADITERKRAEHALRASEQRFRRLIDSAPDAMVIVDEDGVIALVNTQAEELFGYPRAEMVGERVEMLLPKGFGQRHVEHRKRFTAKPRRRPMGAGMDLLARRKDGSQFAAEISLSPLQTESGLLISAAVRDISAQLLRQLEQVLVPRMAISARWQLAWSYRPCVRSMLLGGDFIGACERRDGSLALLIGDVAGHGAAAAGTGAMLRAAWLGAVQAGVEIESIPQLLDRLLIRQADHGASPMATVCLAEIDAPTRELRLVRAGHESPLLITRSAVTAVSSEHGPALGLRDFDSGPLERVELPSDAAIMLFTDGLTERRDSPSSPRRFRELAPRIDARALLAQPPAQAIDEMLAQLFPRGTEHLDDDVAVILLNLGPGAVAEHTLPMTIVNAA